MPFPRQDGFISRFYYFWRDSAYGSGKSLSGHELTYTTVREAVAAPIIVLTKRVASSQFLWNVKAEKAFSELKRRFCLQLILITPSPSLPFIVEVDASEVGVGAILS